MWIGFDANGANSLTACGSAYLFYKDEGGVDNWGQVKKITASDRNSLTYFGNSVSLSDSIAVIAAYGENEECRRA